MTKIFCPIDNGNINVLKAINHDKFEVEIKGDNNKTEVFQWFNFGVEGEIGQKIEIIIKNAKDVKFNEWNKYTKYKAYASYQNDVWFNIEDTNYDESTGELSISFALYNEIINLAFFPPYNFAKHEALIKDAEKISNCNISSLGETNGEDRRDITLLTFGKPASHKKEIWIIARQHPGEPQAEWYAEAIIKELDNADSDLFDLYTFRIVPNMNPDGTFLGNLRTNKEGADLNREWSNPSTSFSPEVYFTLKKMHETGVHFFMDVHSDEIIPKAFLDEAHLSCPQENIELETLEREFLNLYMQHNKDMQNVLNYGEKNRNDPVNMQIAAMYVGNTFNCPAFTLEMPTKEWSWQKCQELAQSFLPVFKDFVNLKDKKNYKISFFEELKLINTKDVNENSTDLLKSANP